MKDNALLRARYIKACDVLCLLTIWCSRFLSRNHRSVGCICQDGFEGKHCETVSKKKGLDVNELVVTATNSPISAGVVVGIVIGIVLLITGFLLFRDRKEKKKRRRRRRLENAGIQTSETFRPNKDAEII